MSSHEKEYAAALEAMRQSGSLRVLPEADTSGMVDLSTNDYLGLNHTPGLTDEFLGRYVPTTGSMSAASSRLLTGNHGEYPLLERSLSDLYGGRSVLVFGSGHHANLGILPALMGKGDLILADKLVHASIIDGMRLSDAAAMRFRHNDMRHLRSLLETHRGEARRCVIVTESVFSMDGDLAPLEAIVELKRDFDCLLYVDEAHGVGVFGSRGEGLMGQLGMVDEADVLVGTCGKALASVGAYAVVSPTIREYLVNRCRPLIFSTALPPLNVAWTRFVIEKMQDMEDRRQNLRRLWTQLGEALGVVAESQIIPFVCGSNESASVASGKLVEAGFYVLPIRHPTVPVGTARLRFSLRADMTVGQLSPIAGIVMQNRKE